MKAASPQDRFPDRQGHPSHAEVLLRSACAVLSEGPRNFASAMSVSLPVDGQNPEELVELSVSLAAEYGLMARAAAGTQHVNVRLLRRPEIVRRDE